MRLINDEFKVLTFNISCVTCALANKFAIKRLSQRQVGLWFETGHVLQTLFVS